MEFCAQADGVLREFVKIVRGYRGLVAAGMGGMLSARALRMSVLEASWARRLAATRSGSRKVGSPSRRLA